MVVVSFYLLVPGAFMLGAGLKRWHSNRIFSSTQCSISNSRIVTYQMCCDCKNYYRAVRMVVFE